MPLDPRCSRIKVFLIVCCLFSEWSFVYLYVCRMIYSTGWDARLFILAPSLRNRCFTVQVFLLQVPLGLQNPQEQWFTAKRRVTST